MYLPARRTRSIIALRQKEVFTYDRSNNQTGGSTPVSPLRRPDYLLDRLIESLNAPSWEAKKNQ